jgi:anti-sigma B factor antagonist
MAYNERSPTMVVHFITRQVEPDVTVVELTGQLTLGTALTEVEQAIRQGIQKGSKRLVLELSKLTFLDSSGVGMLVVCSGVMERAGGRLVIAGAGGKVKEVLELTHLDRVTGMYSDLASACAAFAEPPLA